MAKHQPLPTVLAHATTQRGISFQLRKDPKGVLEVPELENALVSMHLGSPARVSCQRGGTRFTGTAVHGDIDIIPIRTSARWEMHDDNDVAFLLSLPWAFLQEIASESGSDGSKIELRNRFQVRDLELQAVGWAIKRELEMGLPSGRLYLDGLAVAAASRVVACHSSARNQPARRSDGLSGARLKRVLSFIEERLAQDLSLDQIAGVAGVSPSHMKGLFRKSMGVPVHQYVIQRRVELAKRLILEDQTSIADIALASGFSHQSHMARHMRRLLGMPPTALKRILQDSL
ncbi:MAG: Transcriptional regulator, AraC family [Candidatus Angelobacter sp.]|nr:Transcriptional regulator, AraC family [Candidatus Angelobacter sp.]